MIHNKRHVTTFRTARESLWDWHWVRMYGVCVLCLCVCVTDRVANAALAFRWMLRLEPANKRSSAPAAAFADTHTHTRHIFTTNGPGGKQNAAPGLSGVAISCQLQFVIWALGHSGVHPKTLHLFSGALTAWRRCTPQLKQNTQTGQKIQTHVVRLAAMKTQQREAIPKAVWSVWAHTIDSVSAYIDVTINDVGSYFWKNKAEQNQLYVIMLCFVKINVRKRQKV